MNQPALYGPWDYANRTVQFPYDDTPTYGLAAEFLNGHGLVEDWGAGVGWMAQFVTGEYRAIDGAWSRWAHEVVDLRTYTSDVPCAFMRHVLEHNAEWRVIFENFQRSWHVRAVLVLFIPPTPEDQYLSDETWPVPDIAVAGGDLWELAERHGARVRWERIETTSQYDGEDMLFMERAA